MNFPSDFYVLVMCIQFQHASDELGDLYEAMGVDGFDPLLQPQAIVVRSVHGKMEEYTVEKVFAEFKPTGIEPITAASWIVKFETPDQSASMAFGMSKMLKRIRFEKQPEDGEVVESSDEEEGLVAEENGDDVYIRKRDHKTTEDDSEYVEINIEEVKVPQGKWRVVSKHVPPKAMLIFRFATINDFRRAQNASSRRDKSHKDKDGFTYNWDSSNEKCRPGLNIFDNDGNELDWDYEHDTRFYDKDVEKKKSEEAEPEPEELSRKRGREDSTEERDDGLAFLTSKRIKTRGRGSVRFGRQSEMDKAENTRPLRKLESDNADEDEFADDHHPDPTPQPWER
ncbi:hypothetical protein L596_012910 [Steinernema carpocapsae]|uniref:Uncharacterized protein n=1 Tax=Steinernema carpocapsae TaxID=34508 RepID=A0A4U5NYH3_STECR|nr:hypothetical protein L596_012910 [Steinernema carpocapsae]